MDTQVRQEETLVWPWWTKRARKERTRVNVCMMEVSVLLGGLGFIDLSSYQNTPP